MCCVMCLLLLLTHLGRMYEGIFMGGGNLDILLLEKRDNSY